MNGWYLSIMGSLIHFVDDTIHYENSPARFFLTNNPGLFIPEYYLNGN
jgi:hypothetical protein